MRLEDDTDGDIRWQGLSAAKLRTFADNPPPGHEHLAPIARGIADCGLAWLPVPQNRKDIKLDKLPSDRPWLILIGDDLAESLGPKAFHHTLKRALAKADHVMLACGMPTPGQYSIPVTTALVCGGAVIVECNEDTENKWAAFIRRHAKCSGVWLSPKWTSCHIHHEAGHA